MQSVQWTTYMNWHTADYKGHLLMIGRAFNEYLYSVYCCPRDPQRVGHGAATKLAAAKQAAIAVVDHRTATNSLERTS